MSKYFWGLAWFLRSWWRCHAIDTDATMILLTLRHRFSGREDTYWGPLEAWLVHAGYRVHTIVIAEHGATLPPGSSAIESWTTMAERWQCLRVVWRQPWVNRQTMGLALWGELAEWAGYHLARQCKDLRVLLPYEGRIWERRLMIGLRAWMHRVRCIGYSHAVLTPDHRTQAHPDGPDLILTMGDFNRTKLIDTFGHPAEYVRTVGALRQHSSLRFEARRRGNAKLLLVLATDAAEAEQALTLLESQALDGTTVRIRPHPTVPLPRTARFAHECSRDDLQADVRWADVVCYLRSTAAIEALAHGVPLIALDASCDPFREFTAFKCTRVMTMRACLQQIAAWTDQDYAARQREGLAYARSVCAPMTDEAFTVLATA